MQYHFTCDWLFHQGTSWTLSFLVSWYIIWFVAYCTRLELITKMYAARDDKIARRSLPWTILLVMIFLLYGNFYIGGAARILVWDTISSPDQAFPALVTALLPPLFAAVALTGIASAAMSTTENISRARQDEIALASHENAVGARDKLSNEIYPVVGVEHDSGPRPGTSLEALSALKPVFDPDGTLTAGNSSPVTDGASAVLLMSEDRAKREGRDPLAFIRTMTFAAHDPSEGLLMAPAIAVPEALSRSGLELEDMDLIEIHEAFGAQVLANAAAWEQGWKGKATSAIDWDKVNVNGSSIAVGHPWAATGGRIVTTLANEMSRRDASFGLVSICAAGAMAGAFILERS